MDDGLDCNRARGAQAATLSAASAQAAMASATSALVLVDYQQRLMPGIHDGAADVAEAVFLGAVARVLGIPVLGTAQNPAGLGPNDPAVQAVCDALVEKMHFDACGDGLLEALQRARPGLQQVVIAGCEAHVCLLQTTLGLLRAGLQVFVVAPACGSRSPADRQLALDRLARAGAVLVSPEMVAFEWLHSCEHADFRGVLALIKQRGGTAAAPAPG